MNEMVSLEHSGQKNVDFFDVNLKETVFEANKQLAKATQR